MGPTSLTPAPPRRRTRQLLLLTVTSGLATLALAVGMAGPAAATTITPAGAGFTASLVPGTTADFTVGAIEVSCNTSSASGTVPNSPANSNPGGPITVGITSPTFSNNGGACPTNIAFTTATTVSFGSWNISLNYNASGSTGSLIVPQGGVVSTTSGLAVCRVTVAPTGPHTITGPLRDATASTLPRLDFLAGVTVPIKVERISGIGCPTAATSAVFSAIYDIANTTDPSVKFVVAP